MHMHHPFQNKKDRLPHLPQKSKGKRRIRKRGCCHVNSFQVYPKQYAKTIFKLRKEHKNLKKKNWFGAISLCAILTGLLWYHLRHRTSI